MKAVKRFLSVFLLISLLLSVFGVMSFPASSAGTYDATAALSYAKAHWNDGVGLCAEFVSKCLNAGGCSSYSASCTALVGQLRNVSMCKEYRIPLNSNMSISMSQYLDKMSPGDPVFFHCSYQGNYQHVVLCNGTDSSGYMKAYSHNRANDGTSRYYYSSKCPECGNNSIDYATVFHFNSKPSCTTHTKGNFLWYEAAHPHYNYWTCAVCGDTFTDGSKATVSSCSECNIARDTRIDYWFSNEEMGEETLLIEPGERMYLCYKLYDANTGDLYNSYKDVDYTVTLTINNRQTGEIEYTSQFNSDDNAWIAIRRGVEGIFDGEIVVSGHLTGTFTTAAAYYASTHTITYDANGGSGAPATQTRGMDAVTLSTTVPSRFGYNFVGWSTSETATTIDYQPGDTFHADIYDPATKSYNTVLYAVWEQAPTLSTSTQDIRPAYITYPGVGIYYKLTPSVTTSYRIFGIADVDNKISLYDASGNLLDSDDDGGDGNQFKLDYVLTAGKTYYIYVRLYSSSSTGTFTFALARGYTISYNPNGGSGAPANSYKYYKIDQTLSAVKPTRTGYTFVGWNTSSSGSGTSYQPGATYSTDSNVTLYAQWEKGCANNNHTYTHTVTKATCTAQGYTTHTCSACGYSYVDTYTSALGHSYSYKVGAEPTTSASGKLTGACGRCTSTTTVTLPKLNTTDYTKTTTKAATCTETGTDSYKWKTTTYGTFTFTATTNALGHNYTSKVTVPTCEAQGYTTYTCSRCSHSYKDSYTSATGHSYSYKATKNPTTSATGTLTGTCSKCAKTTTVILPRLNTTDYTKTTAKAATCTETGTDSYKWKTTTYGTFTFTATTNALGHSYTSKVTAPTCEAQGYTTYTCSRCSHSYKDSYTSATGHSYSYKATKNPTTSATGTLTGTCSKCAKTTTVTLPRLNTTDYTKTTAKAATCTDTGTDNYKWKTTTYGTFTFAVTTDALGHNYTSKVTAPTCEAQGYTTYTCSRCSHSYKDSYKEALGHDWDNGTVTEEPTENEAGQILYRCIRCTETKTDVLPALGHTHSYSKKVVAPTCTEQGYTIHACSCGDSYKDNYTAAKGHSYSNGACVNCGAADPEFENFHNPFEDVKEKDYFYTPVLWAVQMGITYGTSATRFSPEAPCTRGQIVTFLWRACGSPEPNMAVNPFSDVSSSAYYYKAVLWAVENGITTGTGKGKFSPEDTCTRGQVATFLWRAQGKPEPTSSVNPFNDVDSNAYYYNAILWAVEKGVTNGTGKGKFSPDTSCTRGQIVTFLYRALN